MSDLGTTVELSRGDLERVIADGVLSAEQAELLWQALAPRQVTRPRLDLPHVAYYTGALLVIGAMSVFMGLAWESFRSGIMLIALVYALGFALGGHALWRRPDYRVAGGLLFTIAVCMTPLAVYGFCRLTGLWPHGDPGQYRDYYLWVRGSWLALEVGTIAAGLATLRFVRFPFLTAPVAFSLWFMSMDITALLFGEHGFTWGDRQHVSLVFGLIIIGAAWVTDYRTGSGEDFARWLYLFGLLALSFGLELFWEHGQTGRLLFALVSVALLLVGTLLARPVFLVFGGIGLLTYLGYLSSRYTNAWAFPFILSALGIAVIILGVQYQRYHVRIEQAMTGLLPEPVRRFLPDRGRR